MMRDVYVVLTNTGTTFSKCIGWVTKEPLNHASIAFDASLQDIYSFGRKHPLNAFSGGFVRERVWGDLVRDRERATPAAIYRCPLRPDTYNNMRSFVQGMREKQERYRYNLAGLFTLLSGIDWQREDAFFCSQFVEHLFAVHGVPLSGKPASLTRPGDFERAAALRLVYEGDLRKYANASSFTHEAISIAIHAASTGNSAAS